MMHYITDFFSSLYALVNDMSPYLLLGFLFAGILKVWFPQRWIDRYMGKSNVRSAINTAILGIPLPLCSCGVIPTGISFYKNGASKGASVSFLISTPQTGVDSILVTYSMLGLPFAIIRVIVALITGIIGGVFTNIFTKKDAIEEVQTATCCATPQKQSHSITRILKYGFNEFLMDIAKWLMLGILIAAGLSVIIPDDFFIQYLNNEPLSMLMVLLASVPLYLCATASVPIALVLMLKGLSPGAALILLMAGPATNAATITVIKKVFGNKTLFSYLGSIIGGAFIFGLAINHLFPREWFPLSHVGHHQHELLPYWIKICSSLLLSALILFGYWQKWARKRSMQQKTSTIIASAPNLNTPTSFQGLSFAAPKPEKIIRVEGMTCSHCKASVEKNLSQLKGIESVEANPSTNQVIISYSKLNLEAIEKTISDLGYTYKGIQN